MGSSVAADKAWLNRWPKWVAKATEIHKGKYSYPDPVRKSVKVGRGVKHYITAICPIHGAYQQLIVTHMRGCGCPKCYGRGKSDDERLQELQEIYPGYRFGTIERSDGTTYVEVICNEHGTSRRNLPSIMSRVRKTPCPQCNTTKMGEEKRLSDSELDERVRTISGGRVRFIRRVTTETNEYTRRVVFSCVEHGEFIADISQASIGKLCAECGKVKAAEFQANQRKLTPEELIERCREVHGDKYEYDFTTYDGFSTPMRIICKDHGEYWQSISNHVSHGKRCRKCNSNGTSYPEQTLIEFVQTVEPLAVIRDREILEGKELDIFIPNKNLAIELTGVYWHSEKFKHPKHLEEKRAAAAEKGVNVLTIYEDEWWNQQNKVKAQIEKHLKGCTTVAARKMRLELIEWVEAKSFLEQYHLADAGKPSNYCLALKWGPTTFAVTTWGKDRFSKEPGMELYRMATTEGIVVVGGLSRMLKRMLNDHTEVTRVITYADKRWGTGESYGKVGFTKVGDTQPGYYWCKGDMRMSRYRFQKHKMARWLPNFDPNKTEVENAQAQGYYRVYDCGHAKWELRR